MLIAARTPEKIKKVIAVPTAGMVTNVGRSNNASYGVERSQFPDRFSIVLQAADRILYEGRSDRAQQHAGKGKHGEAGKESCPYQKILGDKHGEKQGDSGDQISANERN